MSQLFEKLDLEVYEDSISTGEMAQVGTYHIAEGGISSEIYGKSKGKDSTMDVDGLHEEDPSSDWISLLFGKSGLEANEDCIRSAGKVAQVETPPLVEGAAFSEIDRSSEKDSTMTKAKKGELFDDDEDEYLDWIIKILKSGGHHDILSRYNLDEGEKHIAHYDVPDEFYDPIEMGNDTMDNCKSMKRVSKEDTIKNGIKWMSEECFLAFTKYAEEINNLEGINHRFGELCYQCLSVEAPDKIFHHYNFTIETEHRSTDVLTSQLYFAEVKQLSGIKSYFCCPLDQDDEGHCYGCKNQEMYDLKHPSTGCYEVGAADICWPFIDDTNSGSDGDDCGGLGC